MKAVITTKGDQEASIAKPREEWTFEETLEYVRALGLGQALDLGFDDLSEEELDDCKREIQEVLGEP